MIDSPVNNNSIIYYSLYIFLQHCTTCEQLSPVGGANGTGGGAGAGGVGAADGAIVTGTED